MSVASTSISAAEVLHAFHRDAPNLFLGAAFTTVGLVALALSALRRKRDFLFIYFGIFAVLYGQRLWINSSLLGMVVPPSAFFTRLRIGINYLVPIPFVLYFRSGGFLVTRPGIIVAYLLVVTDSALAVLTFVSGPKTIYDRVNNAFVIVALAILIWQFIWKSPRHDRDFVVLRRGFLAFAGLALWDNVASMYFSFPKVESMGFALFLTSLGYVAARQTIERDRQLTEIQNELDIARRMQLSILPVEFPRSEHFHVAARYVPMTSVAGDFYDYVVAGNGQAGLLIADVSGHGVPAALIASMVKMAATSQKLTASDPSQLLLGMNAALCGNTQNQFVTAAYVYLDSFLRELRYSAAGHPPMLLLRNGSVVEVEENGLMLGAFRFATYSTTTQRLEPGDRLLLYTDGIIEACNPAGEFLGREGLGDVLRRTTESSPAEAADLILSSVQRWSATQNDDLTLIVCDFAKHREATA